MLYDLFEWMGSRMTREVWIWMIPATLLIGLVIFIANRPIPSEPASPTSPTGNDR